MIRPDFDSLGAQFFDNAPILRRAEVQARHAAWYAGETVLSQVTAVGLIPPTPEEEAALSSGPAYRTNYTIITNTHALVQRTTRAREMFAAIVGYDAGEDRGGFGGEAHIRTFGGYFTGEAHIPWHSHDHARAGVRYIRCIGAGPTQGALGEISRADIMQDGLKRGDLLPEVVVAPGERLKPVLFEPGTVLRVDVDIHGSSAGFGPRLLEQASYTIPS